MARKFYNPRPYPIHVDDGTPVPPGGKFSAKGDEDWLAVLLVAGDATPVDASAAEDVREVAERAVEKSTAAAAKVQARATTGDDVAVPASDATTKEQTT